MGAYIINVPDTVDTIIYVNIGDVYDGKTYIASQRVEDLTPYTEPDLEQVRKEAYDKGYDDAAEEKYNDGLADAWDAARKIANMPYGEEEKVFGSGGWAFITNHTASEAIEKIRAYEQEKEEIQVGDEVIIRDKTAVVTEITDRYVRIMYSDGSCYALFSKGIVETGRHFPEIAEVLQKMKESDNG